MKKTKYDVAVLGWWYGLNYGSVLTYYSLQKAISDLGYNVLMVHEPLGYNGWRVKWKDDIMSMNFARRMGYNYTEQLHYTKLNKLNNEASTFLVGSDQLWNPLIGRVNDDLFLDFVSPENKRVAYATSFGNKTTSKFKPDFIKRHSNNLKQFSGISVREAYGIDTAKNVFGVEATQVLDPVFLIERAHYEELADNATIKVDGKYMLIFILDPNNEKRKVILSVAKKLGFEKIVVVPNPDKGREKATEVFYDDIFYIVPEDGPENFLHAYKEASYVVTDSFHGTAFSIIFNRPFSSIYNTQRGADRFVNILGELGYGESRRLFLTDTDETIAENKNIAVDAVDFKVAEQVLNEKKEKSITWLKNTLEKKKPDWQDGVKAKPKPIIIEEQNEPGPFNSRVTLETNKNDLIKINNTSEGSIAEISKNAEQKGNYVWFKIPHKLIKSKAYRLTVNWNIKSSTKKINIHLMNPNSYKFRIIGQVSPSKDNSLKKDNIEFKVDNPESDLVMLGGLHITGENPSVIIKNIEITPIDKFIPNLKLAVPPNQGTPEQIKQRVLDNPNIAIWSKLLNDEFDSLEFYLCKYLEDLAWNAVGGPADFLIYPKSAEDIIKLLNLANSKLIPVTIIGNATNLLVREGGIRGFVISTIKLDYMKMSGDDFIAGAGANLIEATRYLLENGKSSLEWAAGVPGSVGGAVYMNAGTNEGDIRRTIKSILTCDKSGNTQLFKKGDINWGKRYTTFMDTKDIIILEATFTTKDGNVNDMKKKMQRTVSVRESHFPLEYPNNGSVFKWWRAPRLISQAGLVGKQIGGAQVSTKQPGFIVNKGNATATDFEALVNHIISTVYEFSGFMLEPEVVIIGEYPHRFERYDDIEESNSDNNLDIR